MPYSSKGYGFALLLISTCSPAIPSLHAQGETENPDETALRTAGIGTDSDRLLDFLRSRSSSDQDLLQLPRLIGQLGSASFQERELAAERLIRLGPQALQPLWAATGNGDLEVSRRASDCVQTIIHSTNFGAPISVVRLLSQRKPEGTEKALLRFLPYAAYDPELEEEIWFALDKLVANNPDLVRVFTAALDDRLPARRAAAAYILGRRGNLEQQRLAEKVFNDTEPLTVLRAAQGLLGSKRKKAIPALINLLDSAPLEIAWQAEEMLRWAASADDPPASTSGLGSVPARKECRSAWLDWWARKGPHLDLSKKDKDPRRPILLLMAQRTAGKGLADCRLWLCGCDGTPRWQLKDVAGDARLLPGNRLLILNRLEPATPTGPQAGLKPPAEPITGEWDLRGNLIKRYQGVRFPGFCCRLPNGNTFLGGRQQYQEISPSGNQVYSRVISQTKGLQQFGLPRITPRGTILVRRQSDDGSKLTELAEVDPAGETILVRTALQVSVGVNAAVEPLASGNYLLADFAAGQVVEADCRGTLVWQYPCPKAILAARLHDGSTVIGSKRGRVFEIDAKGEIGWEVFLEENNCWFRPCLTLVRLGFDAPRRPGSDLVREVRRRAKGLESKDVTVRRRSAQSLEDLGPKAEPAIPALIRALGDADAMVAQYAENALAGLQSAPVPALLEAVRTGEPKIKVKAISALARVKNLRRHSEAIAPVLLNALKDDRAEVRSAAANVLGALPRCASVIVPALMRAVKDSDHEVRLLATHSLGLMGPAGRPAGPLLIENLSGNDVQLRSWSALALGQIGPIDPAIVPALAQFLGREDNAFNRAAAANALGKMGAKAREAVPSLIQALGKKDPAGPETAWMARRAVVKALGDIGPDAAPAVPELMALVRDGGVPRDVRIGAIRSLGKIGPAAREAIPLLREKASEIHDPLSEVASQAVKEINRK